jgi:hypothetical protein
MLGKVKDFFFGSSQTEGPFRDVRVITFDNYTKTEKVTLANTIEDFESMYPRFIDGKQIYLVEKNPQNGQEAEADELNMTKQYRPFVPRRLPEKYGYMTPEWLYSGIDWKPQAQEIRVKRPDQVTEKISIGLAIAIIIFALIIVFLILVIAMG